MSPYEILYHFYPEEGDLRRLLIHHSEQVRDRALAIADSPACAHLHLDRDVLSAGALLHDVGIGQCHAPSIYCNGTEPYIAHGVIGGRMLRDYAATHPEAGNLEPYARICERHTGSGVTADEVRRQNLPISPADYLPESAEERLICLADKFYSKSHPDEEISVARARQSLLKFGADTAERFDALCRFFGL